MVFGHVIGDKTDKKRTVEHIVGELRSALKQLNIKGPYVLMLHSISGTKAMTAWNGYNKNIVQEANELVGNVKKLLICHFHQICPYCSLQKTMTG
ncbi:hypothetical protein [Paenibacillus sp. FSL K6-1318]|uniref:hypothetical protein n=1 Tax=Paenibacillus sp. FSL K6-1318 TaxID=2975291 RepID=UPI0030EEBA65